MADCGVSIFSVDLSGLTTEVTFFPQTGGTVNLGTQTFPFSYVADYYYGTYSCYVPTYAYTYTIVIPAPTPTPTPTNTETPTNTPTTTPTPTNTETPTTTPTPTNTITPTVTSTPTPTPYRNFIVSNQSTSGATITDITPVGHITLDVNYTYPVTSGQIVNGFHTEANSTDGLEISVEGTPGVTVVVSIFEKGVLTFTESITTPDTFLFYDLTQDLTENDLLEVVLNNPVQPTPTPTNTATPTNTPTNTATPTNTPTFTPTNTTSPTPTSTPIPFIPGDFTFDADYIVVTYAFNDGTDLDTRTRVTVPDIGQNSLPDYIGWCCAEQWPTAGNPILTWGGDNTGVGFESVLIDLIQFKNDYPGQNIITIQTNAAWYGTVGTNPVYIQAKLYKGGTMVADPDNYSFINQGFTSAYGTVSSGVVINLELFGSCIDGENIKGLEYNLTNYQGRFI